MREIVLWSAAVTFLFSVSPASAGWFGKDEKRIARLGEDISRYVYFEKTFLKFDFIFNGCSVDIIAFKRKYGNKTQPFMKKGIKAATVDILKLDEMKVKTDKTYGGDDIVVAQCSDYVENCIVDANGKETNLNYIVTSENAFPVKVQTGRGEKVSKWITELIEECKE